MRDLSNSGDTPGSAKSISKKLKTVNNFCLMSRLFVYFSNIHYHTLEIVLSKFALYDTGNLTLRN